MKKQKSFFWLGIVVLILSLVLAACSSPPEPSVEEVPAEESVEEVAVDETTEEEVAEAVTLELYHDKPAWADNTDAMGQSAAEAVGTGFITVRNEDPTTFQATVRASLGTDQAPDLFTWWSGYRMEDIVQAGGAADLTDIWHKYLDSGEYGQGVADAFTFDGKIYAAPFNLALWVVYYNKPLFEEHGLQPPTTWEEFVELNDALLELGITPLSQTFVDRWQAFIVFEEMILRTQGPEFYNQLMRGEVKYTDPGVVEALELWASWMEKGYLSNDYAFGTATDTFLPAFQAGKVAMLPIGDWYSATFVGAGLEPGVDFDAFIMPNVDVSLPAALFFEASPLMVGENSPNKEDGLKVINWWMSVDAQNQWCDAMGFSPPNSQSNNPSAVGQNVQAWVNENSAEMVLRYWEATPADIVDVAVDELSRFMLDPSEMMNVLETIQEKADQVWAER